MSQTEQAESRVNTVPLSLEANPIDGAISATVFARLPGFDLKTGVQLLFDRGGAEGTGWELTTDEARTLGEMLIRFADRSEREFGSISPEEALAMQRELFDQDGEFEVEREFELEQRASIVERQITVLSQRGSMQVTGWCWRDKLAVNQVPYDDGSTDEDDYTVTHLPTGCLLSPYVMTREQAIDLMMVLTSDFWDDDDPLRELSVAAVGVRQHIDRFAQEHTLRTRTVSPCG